MAIKVSEIEVGYLYRTETNQHRVVLDYRDGQVIYASRGGNVLNEFTQRDKCKNETFAEVCSEKLYKINQDEFDKIKQSCNFKK